MSPKVYEVSRGRKMANFTLYPTWRCPTCKIMRREPIGKRCKYCRERVCPKCGHEVVTTESIGLGKGELICPMNMPYQGCGWRRKL